MTAHIFTMPKSICMILGPSCISNKEYILDEENGQNYFMQFPLPEQCPLSNNKQKVHCFSIAGSTATGVATIHTQRTTAVNHAIKRSHPTDPCGEVRQICKQNNKVQNLQNTTSDLQSIHVHLRPAWAQHFRIIIYAENKTNVTNKSVVFVTRGQSNLTKSASWGPIPRLGVTPGGRKLYH